MMRNRQWQKDYSRIEKALGFLDQHYADQPSLRCLADHVGLSAFHFQRLFRRWVGVSPKQFLEALTLEHAKTCLRQGKSLLDASFDVGLSGPSRLHDLFVTVDAMTPGEYKKRGEDLEIRYGFHMTPFGECFVAVTGRGICALSFLVGADKRTPIQSLMNGWSKAQIIHDATATDTIVRSVFLGQQQRQEALALVLKGSNFQIKVWKALLRIAPGTVVSYQDIARVIGAPRSYRAVANTVAHNPIVYVIPCHRVIRNTGVMGQYRWGAVRKKAMIGWEAAKKPGLVAQEETK